MMTGKGKIARLPDPIREQINRRLQNGDTAKQIAAWLNSLPETKALIAAGFGGCPVNEMNITHWRQGGFRDWHARQDTMEVLHRLGPGAAQILSVEPTSVVRTHHESVNGIEPKFSQSKSPREGCWFGRGAG
jgi:hypothetical protein